MLPVDQVKCFRVTWVSFINCLMSEMRQDLKTLVQVTVTCCSHMFATVHQQHTSIKWDNSHFLLLWTEAEFQTRCSVSTWEAERNTNEVWRETFRLKSLHIIITMKKHQHFFFLCLFKCLFSFLFEQFWPAALWLFDFCKLTENIQTSTQEIQTKTNWKLIDGTDRGNDQLADKKNYYWYSTVNLLFVRLKLKIGSCLSSDVTLHQ